MHPFILTSEVPTARGARIIEVPPSLSDKESLLSWFGHELRLPSYFGQNWDALYECLRDLSWIEERTLVLFHRALPLQANLREQALYINVLADAARDWKPGEAHEIIVAFDTACESRVVAALETKP